MIIKGNITDRHSHCITLPNFMVCAQLKILYRKASNFFIFSLFLFSLTTTDVVQIISVSKHKIGQNEKENMANFEVFQRA